MPKKKTIRKKVVARKKARISKAGAKKVRGKKQVRKPAAKKRAAVKLSAGGISLEKIGEVSHYFPKVRAAAVKILKGGVRVGDEIYIKGHTTDFKERIASMQLDHISITDAKKGDEIGLLVKSRVRIGDSVYRV